MSSALNACKEYFVDKQVTMLYYFCKICSLIYINEPKNWKKQ
jgi:hypothetical protein